MKSVDKGFKTITMNLPSTHAQEGRKRHEQKGVRNGR